MSIAPDLQRASEEALDELMAQVKGVKAIVIATEDGFEVAARVQNTAQVSRLCRVMSPALSSHVSRHSPCQAAPSRLMLKTREEAGLCATALEAGADTITRVRASSTCIAL